VAEIIVIEHSDRAIEDVSERGQLERLHLRERHKQPEFVVPHVELEERSSSYDLESRQPHMIDIDVTDENVAGDLTDVLKEAQVVRLVLNPGDFEVSIDIGAVVVAFLEVFVVELAVRGNAHSSICADANCKEKIVKVSDKIKLGATQGWSDSKTFVSSTSSSSSSRCHSVFSLLRQYSYSLAP
jgi:hypothetical protein